jgi:hypothetical protein
MRNEDKNLAGAWIAAFTVQLIMPTISVGQPAPGCQHGFGQGGRIGDAGGVGAG